MTAKEYLKQYEYADKRAKRLQAEYERELELIDSVRSTLGGDGMPHGSGVSRRTEDAAVRLADKAMRWKMAQVEAIEKRQEVFELIHDVEGTEGEILYERYINLRRWEDICVVIHLSWRQTHRLHGKALNLIEEKMALNGTHL
jgi:DNA-directed RNA polymerase specialized sigma subunit